jgi:hypothetical protein
MNPSGGVRWHWRAWRSQALWQPTQQQIASWLATVKPQAPELLIIGASAGWMMSTPWLQRFKKVSIWDIDRLAGPLFRWRHGQALQASGTELVCHQGDALKILDEVLLLNPQACVLFDNVLGQVRFHHTDVEQAGRELKQLVRLLKGREWGSLHDAYSGPVVPQPRKAAFPRMQKHKQRPGGAAADFSWLTPLGAQGEWLDHLTATLFEDGTWVHHMAWPYRPDYWHWLQAGWVHVAPKSRAVKMQTITVGTATETTGALAGDIAQ